MTQLTLLMAGLAWVSFPGAIVSAAIDSDEPAVDLDCPYYPTKEFSTPEKYQYEFDQIQVNDGQVTYKYFDQNEDGKLVVLIPGMPLADYYDVQIVPFLEANYRVLLLELPGKNGSHLDPSSSSRMTKAYAEVLSALNINLRRNELFIVGTSMGGALAASLAVRLHEYDPRVALLSPLGLPRRDFLFEELGKVPLVSKGIALVGMDDIAEKDVRNAIACPERFPRLFESLEADLSSTASRLNYLKVVQALALTDQALVYEALSLSGLRTLLLYGEYRLDPYLDQLGYLLGILGNSTEYLILENSGHVPHIERPRETHEILRKFFEAKKQGEDR